jgi:5'-3' exonuclease
MNKIACIDVDHVFYLSLTGEKLLDENGEPIKVDGKFTYRERTFEESCNVADTYLTNILQVTNATHYVGFFGGSSKARKEIYSEYKANRKDVEPLKNLYEMKMHLADKWQFNWLSGYQHETDDYVASFIKQTPDTFIVSPDKDLLNLEGNHYNPKKNEWVFIDPWAAERYFFASMIIGDTSDNIPGLKGKGEAFVNKVFTELKGYAEKVLSCYIDHYKDTDIAIEKYYEAYKSLKLVNNLDISTFAIININNDITE